MKRARLTTKAEGMLRLMMVRGLSGILPLYIVTEYPKSGGSWFGQMLAECIGVPFPRNRFPAIRSSVLHGHYLYSPLMNNVFVMIRDGRDVMVSFYYHSYFINERFNERLVQRTKKELPFNDYDNIQQNLSRFIEYKFTRRSHPRFTWSDFVDSWIDKKDVCFVYYEELLREPALVLERSVKKICGIGIDKDRLAEIVEKYSFKNLSQRTPGQEDKSSFLRKGIAGDWKNCFSHHAKEIFCRFAGGELIRLGYEQNDQWARG